MYSGSNVALTCLANVKCACACTPLIESACSVSSPFGKGDFIMLFFYLTIIVCMQRVKTSDCIRQSSFFIVRQI